MIIGLVGRSRVGKDPAASFFEGTHQVRRLAQPVKDACKVLYGWSDVNVESAIKEDVDPVWGVTPRFAMVHLTHSTRVCAGADFFTRRFFDSWDGSPIVIPDVRFEDDVREIHRLGGVTIKITRKGGPEHIFESSIDTMYTMYEVENNGTIEQLRENIFSCLGREFVMGSKPVETLPHSDA
jgi:hypothetical protein